MNSFIAILLVVAGVAAVPLSIVLLRTPDWFGRMNEFTGTPVNREKYLWAHEASKVWIPIVLFVWGVLVTAVGLNSLF